MMSETTKDTDNLSLPSGFTAVQYADGSDYTCELLDELRKDDAEVWLIKAPLGVGEHADLKALNGQKIKLDRTSRCKCEIGASLQYEIAHHSSVPNKLGSSVLMMPDFDHGVLKPCNARISGFLSISEAVVLPDIQYPPAVEHKVPFPNNLKLRYVPFGVDPSVEILSNDDPVEVLSNDHPIEVLSNKLKKRKHSAISDDVSTLKKKSKKSKHKDSLNEDSSKVNHITKEEKRSKYVESSVEDADEMLQPKKELMTPSRKKHRKHKVNSEDECDKVMKSAKRTKIEKNCDYSSTEDFKNVVKIKEEKLSPDRKSKKSKRKQSLTEDSDGGAVIGSNSSPVCISNKNMSEDSDTNVKERKKHKKHKKEK